MWLVDGAEYYSPPGARYLTYSNDVRQYIADLTATRYDGILPLLHRHIIAMSYQLAQFRWEGGRVGGTGRVSVVEVAGGWVGGWGCVWWGVGGGGWGPL